MNSLKIVIDEEILNKYHDFYFKIHPRRKIFPVKIFPPSLNMFIAMKRMQQNTTKQNYKDFGRWLAEYYRITNLNLKKVCVIYSFYFSDRRRRDMDNLILACKFYQDAFVSVNVFADDNGNMLRLEFEDLRYDKINPRIEIVIVY